MWKKSDILLRYSYLFHAVKKTHFPWLLGDGHLLEMGILVMSFLEIEWEKGIFFIFYFLIFYVMISVPFYMIVDVHYLY